MNGRNRSNRPRDLYAVKNSDNDARVIRSHCDYLRRTGATENTLLHRRGALRRLSEALPCELTKATDHILDQWQSGLRVQLTSIATYTNHVSGFYSWAHMVGLIDTDPSSRLARPRIPERKPRPIPPGDLELALTCAVEPVYTWIVLGICMGLRAHEVAAIRREDVTEAVIAGGRRLILSGIGKGNRPFRLPVPAHVVPILRAHLGGRPGPLWHTPTGLPASAGHVTKEVTAFFRGLDLPHTMHCCRHTFCTGLHRESRDLLLVAEYARHRSLNTTRGYVEVGEDEGLTAVDHLAEGWLAGRGNAPDAAAEAAALDQLGPAVRPHQARQRRRGQRRAS